MRRRCYYFYDFGLSTNITTSRAYSNRMCTPIKLSCIRTFSFPEFLQAVARSMAGDWKMDILDFPFEILEILLGFVAFGDYFQFVDFAEMLVQDDGFPLLFHRFMMTRVGISIVGWFWISGMEEHSYGMWRDLNVAKMLPRGLKSLHIDSALRDEDGMAKLAAVLPECEKLTHFTINGEHLSVVGCELLGAGLQNSQNITHLSLAGNGIRWCGVKAFFSRFFASYKGLSHLDLNGNSFGYLGIDALVNVGLGGCFQLTYLSLEANYLGRRGSHCLASSFCKLTRLETLNLSLNNMRSEGFLCIAPALCNLTRLKFLNLAYNKLSSDCVEILVSTVFDRCVELTHLSLEGNRIRSTAMLSLGLCIGKLKFLSCLKLSWCSLGNDDIKILFGGLEHCKLLSRLDLHGNYITAEGAIFIHDNIGSLKALSRLDLSSNDIVDGDQIFFDIGGVEIILGI